MTTPSITYAELEALHDVIEASKCYWHANHADRSRAEQTLKLVNSLYWGIGEHLPTTGTPSERFQPVQHSSSGDDMEALVGLVLDLSRQYNNAHDPWFADTVVVSSQLAEEISHEQLEEFTDSLIRLGFKLEFNDDVPPDRIDFDRRNWGPWLENTARTST